MAFPKFLAVLVATACILHFVSAVQCSSTLPDIVDGDLIVDGNCFVNDITVKGDIKSDGPAGSLFIFKSKAKAVDVKNVGLIFIDSSVIKGGGVKIADNKDPVLICNSTIIDVLEYKDSKGDIILGAGLCPRNFFKKDIKIEKIEGNVIIGDDLNGDGELSIIEVDGNITLNGGTFTKITIEKNKGNISLNNIKADEVVIKDNDGSISIAGSTIANLDCQSNNSNPVCTMGNMISASSGQCSNC